MGYTYAIQVTVGRELDVKARLVNAIKRFGNPGIIAIHALETFEQTLSETGMSYRKWRAKVTGYIFVTVEHSSKGGLGMDAKCWQLIKRIPFVSHILNCYIQHDEWNDFFKKVDSIEPKVKIVETKTKLHAVTDETIEQECEESPNITLIEAAAEVLKSGKAHAVAALQKAVKAVETVARESRTIVKVPLSLYKILLEIYRKKSKEKKSMTVQNALHELKALLKGVVEWKN